ncbi:MAG: hypothetical protein L3V56_14860 [Candidatus Magnetoovum sp. WYHC-5]|nr:hypothetical protein [Candidatus Magnetoovum sp. WYHC-5]
MEASSALIGFITAVIGLVTAIITALYGIKKYKEYTKGKERAGFFYVTLIMLAPFLTLGFIIFVFFGFILLIIMRL